MKAVQQTTPRLVRMSDAASMLGIGRSTLKRLIAEGRLEKVTISARASRIPVASIEQFIAASKAPGKGQ